jgi:heat shock protein HslJ
VKKYLLILFLLSLAISACSAPATQEPADALIGAWKLTAYGPVNAPISALEGVEAQLMFNADGTLTGNSGCNGYSGSYTVEGNQITFRPIVSTRMLCDKALMEQETAIHQVLTGTASFKIQGNQLTLTNSDRMLAFTAAVSYPSYP